MTKFFISTVLMFLSIIAFGQNSLSIYVTNQKNVALSNASVVLVRTQSLEKQTDQNGSVQFDRIAAANYQIRISHVGYTSLDSTIKVTGNQSLNIRLKESHIRTEEVLVTATRAKNNASTTFKNISKEDIDRANIGQDIPFLLNQTPSVIVSSDAGNGIGYTSITIRGSSNERINVTLDGIPLNDAESMGSFFVNVPDFASSVQNIQVQRGIGTSTNGAGAFGASLNIQTNAVEEKPYAELNNSYGSYNSWKNTVKVGTGLINDKFAFNARLSRIASDGYIERASSDLKSFYMDAGYYGKKQTLKATLFSGKEKTYQAWYGTPEPLLKGNNNAMEDYAVNALEFKKGSPEYERFMNADRRYNYYTYDNQTDNYTQTHARLHYSNYISDKVNLSAALHYTRGQGYYEEFRPEDKLKHYSIPPVIFGKDTTTTADLVRRRWLDNHFYGATYALNYQPSNELKLTFGGAYNQYRGDHYGEVIWSRFASTSELGDKYYFNEASKYDFSVYAKADYSLDKWLFNMDIQYRNLHYKANGEDDKVKNLHLHDDLNFVNPKAGVTYLMNTNSHVYASYAFANKEPIRKDYVENPLNEFPRPEKMQNIEAGYRYATSSLNIGANFYGMFYKDQLIPTGAINDVGSAIRQNVDKSYRAGLELDAAWNISRHFTWRATAAFSENKINNFTEYVAVYNDDWETLDPKEIVYDKTTIAMSASTIVSNEFAYKPISNLEFNLQTKYVSRMYLDNTESKERSIDPFTSTNFNTRYSFSALGLKKIDLFLQVNNIFNEKYATGGYTWGSMDSRDNRSYYNFYTPQATANYMLGMNVRF